MDGRLFVVSVACGLVVFLAGYQAMAESSESSASNMIQGVPPVPAFEVPASRRQWETDRTKIRKTAWALLGKLPPRPARPEVKQLSREDRGDYVVEKFSFDNQAGATVTGYLLLPTKVQGKAPGILYCHWHGGNYEIGKEELFRTHAVPVAPGPALAKAGFVVVAIDAYCFGERNGQGPGGPEEKGGGGEMSASKFNLWFGRTLWGMILRDDLMALDYLCSRPEVDAARIGVTGISMGATRTWWLMALDERLKAGVAVACLTRYQDLIATKGLPCHGIYYFVPGMLNYFDTEAIVALAAPRPMLFMTGDQDAGSPVEGIRKIEKAVTGIYKLYGAEADDHFRSVIYPGLGHVYTPEMWNETMTWLSKNLK